MRLIKFLKQFDFADALELFKTFDALPLYLA